MFGWIYRIYARYDVKKFRRKQSHFLYRVIHQEEKPNIFVYINELLLALPLEILRVGTKVTLSLLSLIIITGSILTFILYKQFYPQYQKFDNRASEIALSSNITDFWVSEASVVYDNKRNVLANLYEGAAQDYIEYKDIPQNVIDAFVAVEDRTFWENDGIDLQGITRVGINYILSSGDEAHGASTITQQLIKNTYLSQEVSLERKFTEILLAVKISQMYPKKDIMEYYINTICYANGIYGIGGASKAYFNKDVQDLTLSQIAYLCAIPNSPTYYDPYVHPEHALTRRNKILADMLECGFIDQSEYTKAIKEQIVIEKPEYVFNNYATTYAVYCATRYLMEYDGFKFRYTFEDMDDYRAYQEEYDKKYNDCKHKLYTGGYKVYTSLDMDAYNELQAKLDNVLSFSDSVNEETGVYELQGAMTVIDNDTRKVIAVVGGRTQESDTKVYTLNRAFYSYRQPGSAFKPIAVYTPAIMKGYTPDTLVYDISVSAAKKEKANVQAMTGTPMSLRSAVEKSRNGVAWQVFDKITPKVGMQFINKMHFTHICPDDFYNASSLGGLTYGVTTVEMASAYSTLANDGVFVDPTCIVSIKDTNNEEIYKEPKEVQVYTPKGADTMVDILKGVLTKGTASGLKWTSHTKTEAFAKTGTTNQSKDGWLCGATPYYSIAVWVGFDQPKELSNLYGATYPGQIWRDSMLYLIQDKEEAKFDLDYDASVEIDPLEDLEGMEELDDLSEYVPPTEDELLLASAATDALLTADVDAILRSMYTIPRDGNFPVIMKQRKTEAQTKINQIYNSAIKSQEQQNLNYTYDALMRESGYVP